LNQLGALEGKADDDVKHRLEQMRSILQEALDGVQADIDDATGKMLALEAQINQDAIYFLDAAECATDVVLNDQLPNDR
jgi:ribosomal protein S6